MTAYPAPYPAIKTPCPECGIAALGFVEATTVDVFAPSYAIKGRLEHRERACLAVACGSCEFISEVVR